MNGVVKGYIEYNEKNENCQLQKCDKMSTRNFKIE